MLLFIYNSQMILFSLAEFNCGLCIFAAEVSEIVNIISFPHTKRGNEHCFHEKKIQENIMTVQMTLASVCIWLIG